MPEPEEHPERDDNRPSVPPERLEGWARINAAEKELAQAIRRQEAAGRFLNEAAAELTAAWMRYALDLERELERRKAADPVEAAAAAPEPLEEAIDILPVLRGISSRRAAERADARKKLERLGGRAVVPLIQVLRREAIKRERRNAAVAGLAVMSIVASFLGLWLGDARFLTDHNWFYWLLGILLGCFGFTTRPTAVQKQAATLLAEMNDVRVIGPVAAALQIDDRYTRHLAKVALKRLLRQVRASDSRLFSAEDVAYLTAALADPDTDLVIAILACLDQIGDDQALERVAKLAEQPAVTARQVRIKEAASNCLAALLVRVGKGAPAGTLLRAAAAPAADDILLRAAASTAEADPALLLRPGDAAE